MSCHNNSISSGFIHSCQAKTAAPPSWLTLDLNLNLTPLLLWRLLSCYWSLELQYMHHGDRSPSTKHFWEEALIFTAAVCKDSHSYLPADPVAGEQYDDTTAEHPVDSITQNGAPRASSDHPSSNLTVLAVGGGVFARRSVPGQSFSEADSYTLGARSPHLTSRSHSWANGPQLNPADIHRNSVRQQQESV